MKKFFSLFFVIAFYSFFASAQKQIIIQANRPIAKVSPHMWGIFFEDINFGADGGLYAELVKNRSFEFSIPMMGWKEIKPQGSAGKILIINKGLQNPENPRFARVSVNGGSAAYGLSNEGFRGMGIQKDKEYIFSLLAKKVSGDVKIKVELVNEKGEITGAGSLSSLSNQWKKQQVNLTATATDAKSKLNIFFQGKGTVDIDLLSMFPKETWKNRPNGMRKDLVQMLADMKPGFIRFPGGCIVEGYELATRYQWKKTIGPVDSRHLMINRWNTEMRNRQAPDYFQTFGLGFYEYFQLAEDLGSTPLPILNCGMACQFNSKEVVPMEQLDPYIQDALDLVEFANGPVTSKWGKVRAGLGHPAPFNMKLLGVGNEQWDEQYIERYKEFEKVFKVRYPQIKLVAAAGPEPADARFDYAWNEFKKLSPAFIDEHYYKPPEWFLSNANRYDNYARKGPKVFAGEYAAHGKESKESESRNTWMSALAEAAFMTGLERNADVVQMASYAPLLAHVDAWQWRPDLIWFDNLNTVGTPNYYVQKLFSVNKGTDVIPALLNGAAASGKDGIYASAVMDKASDDVIIKLVNTDASTNEVNVSLEGAEPLENKGIATVLTSADEWAFNTITEKKVVPVEQSIEIKNKKISLSLPARSFYVIRIKCKSL
jgi:alpha-L-arabinofuranosidase